MPLEVVSLNAVARSLERPFSPVPVARVGDLALSLFVCQGQIDWHTHVDEDELFLVHEGVVGLETERGRLALHSEELALVPKGVRHRSGSALRSVVVLMRLAVLADRHNGHRAGPAQPPLEKVRLARVLATMPEPYRPVTLARVSDFDLLAVNAAGFGPSAAAPPAGSLWLVMRGAVGIELAAEHGAGARLEAGELAVVPPGTTYRVTAADPSLVLTLARATSSD
jgi:mannose-6-phosphate isomerase-like protein (cupin superfamily)